MESKYYEQGPISLDTVKKALREWLIDSGRELKKVLIIPPDATRGHSLAGPITKILYDLLPAAQVQILPALGTHFPMSTGEKHRIFGPEIPLNLYLDHKWRTEVQPLGEIPGEYVARVSGGLLDYSILVEINQEILAGGYDLILSVGQVVPHEVSGMANYTKNVVVGCGGKEIIDKSHFLGAVCGLEKIMGRDRTAVRKVFDYAEENFLKDLPLAYILTVTKTLNQTTTLEGLFLGREREVFARAVALSQKHNLDLLKKPLKKVVTYLDPQEFKSTWLGNKAVYRTRMAIADGGQLLILAPGVRSFGEDQEIDRLIRLYGYQNHSKVLKLVETEPELKNNLSVAAHLIHGSSDGRFKITYAVQHLTEEEIRGVNYDYLPYNEALQICDWQSLEQGPNLIQGEEIFFVRNPALGLWALEQDFQ